MTVYSVYCVVLIMILYFNSVFCACWFIAKTRKIGKYLQYIGIYLNSTVAHVQGAGIDEIVKILLSILCHFSLEFHLTEFMIHQ